jgi:SEC-C motif domain protein
MRQNARRSGNNPSMSAPVDCPCGSDCPYAQCCAPLHAGEAAPTAEALMRSRYSAYVLGLEPYLLASWHRSTRPKTLHLGQEKPTPRWHGLKVLRYQSVDADNAFVEFVAKFKVGGGSMQRLRELSRFKREGGHWYYVGGEWSA